MRRKFHAERCRGIGVAMPGSRDGVWIDGYVPLELAIAILQATTVGILAVVDADAECIGYVRCEDSGDRSRAYRVARGLELFFPIRLLTGGTRLIGGCSEQRGVSRALA